MKLAINPVPAWRTANTTRRIVAVALYTLSLVLVVAAVASWPFTVADGAWWGRLVLLVGGYFTFDFAHVALRGSKAREQIV